MATIVIDDSGSPGDNIESQFLTNLRKTWVAVLINDSCLKSLQKDLKYIKNLFKKFNIDELHFADLINGNGNYKVFTQEKRLALLDAFCMFFRQYKLPFFVQTTNPDTLGENGLILALKKISYKGLDLADYEVQGLFLLFLRVVEYLKENNMPNGDYEIIIDEGLKKAGTRLEIPLFQEYTFKLKFEQSKNNLLLQIADFVAYSVNRMQRTMVKDPALRTSFDKEVIYIISEAFHDCKASGVKLVGMDINISTKDDYDYEHIKQRMKDGNIGKYWDYRKFVN